MTDTVAYVYGIALAPFDAAKAPAGLDDCPVSVVQDGEVCALVSFLPSARYAGESLEALTGDVAWLGSRAVEHDRVLTWASDRSDGAVAPLPMFSLFRDEGSVRAMLRERGAALATLVRRLAGAREYTVRLYRVDPLLRASLSSLSPRIAALEEEAARATPGQRYLLERKIEGERKAEVVRTGQEMARRIHGALSAVARQAVTEPPAPAATADAPGILLATMSYLVPNESVDALRREVTAFVADVGERGFHVDFTGPWPPYHFARDERAHG